MTITQARQIRSKAIQARIVSEAEVSNFNSQAYVKFSAETSDTQRFLGKVDVFIAEKILDKARKLQRIEEIS